ncbi:MAG: F0F1 ATP synthase subunit A [Acidobacteriaceae bacterium]|jgi:F-type H+-transporting ATPase subunit a
MPTQLLFTRLLNDHLAAPVDALLRAFHLQPAYPSAPINDTFAMELLVFFGLLVYFVAVRLTLDVERPAPVQHLAEAIHGFVSEQGESIIGHGYERYISFVTVVALFVLLCNLLGLIPGLKSPTADVVVPFGCAILTFLYYNYNGIRTHGFGYIKQFLGPVWWLTWLLFPIELISHMARLLSLTVRLYANIFAGDMVILAFFSLIPIGFPLLFMGLHVMVAFVQAFLFMALALIYLSLAVGEEH